VIELQQYAKKNRPNLHILSKLQEEMKRLAAERVIISPFLTPSPGHLPPYPLNSPFTPVLFLHIS
jgi:hypothetical protein